MAKKRVNTTRMELLRLRRRATLAKKGHKLLKDKLDGLIQRILKIVKEYQALSGQLEKELIDFFQKLALSSAQINPQLLASAASSSTCTTNVEISLTNIMGVKIPKYHLKIEGNPISYGFTDTPAELDQALTQFKEILSNLVKLAELNKALVVMASQIIEIKRRVNALEYILIPELDSAVKLIRAKLSEMERESLVSLMKIKDIVRAR